MTKPFVRVNRDRCQGVQMCIAWAPGAFEAGPDGLTIFRPDGEWTLEQLEEAVENCPTETLTLVLDGDEETG
ncbi:ferredoxin [Sporichthya polymorpha]|uniref:ferredoxin n=1 Tax=Sporichthya polymorpha TaxID=35751 RepID=UPI00036954D8|nr:ferredoxin [Sporichthya polymorpha]